MSDNIRAGITVVFGIVIVAIGYFIKSEVAPMLSGGILIFAGVVLFIYNKVHGNKDKLTHDME